MKCSFAKISLRGIFEPVWEFGTELYGRFLYLESEKERVLIAAFDFLGTFPSEAARWKTELSKLTDIPEKGLWYHELQIHAAPEGRAISGKAMDELIKKSACTVNGMKQRAEEFDCEVCEADLGDEISFNREHYIPELGGVTVWTGMTFDANGTPCTNNPDIMLLRGYKPDIPALKSPVYFDNPNDPKAYLFVFRNKRGEVIGTVSRFAAHPDVALLFEHCHVKNPEKEYRYNHDWPGYMCKLFEEKYGGTSVYLNGPCADICTKKGYEGISGYTDSDAECRRIGKYIGDRLSESFDTEAFVPDFSGGIKTAEFRIELPMKDDFPKSRRELYSWQLKTDKAQRELEEAVKAGASPSRIKRLIDERWRTGNIPGMVCDSQNFTDKELSERKVTVAVHALRLGEYLFVGVPGESLTDMTLWLRSEFTGVKTIPVDQTGGYYNYMATPTSLALGGYTYWSSWVRNDAIPILKKKLYLLLRNFISQA